MEMTLNKTKDYAKLLVNFKEYGFRSSTRV